MNEPLLEVRGLVKEYRSRAPLIRRALGQPDQVVRAVGGVSFDILSGEVLGLIGESGCGKSSLGRTLIKLQEPTAGTISFSGTDIGTLSRPDTMALRGRAQIIFQDPYASLNPRRTVKEIVGLPLQIQGIRARSERDDRVEEMICRVGLRPDQLRRYPHQFSGGQRQRIGIARALITKPEFIVCDEPVSALDVSIKAQILELLSDLRHELGLTYLFISHDISTVGYLADRIAVMYLGEIVEIGPAEAILQHPLHPYTRALMSAVPHVHAKNRPPRVLLNKDLPSPLNPPSGCKFHTRCPHATARCKVEVPALRRAPGTGAASHHVACFLYDGPPDHP